MDLFGINIGSFEGALATAIVMAVGWVLQYRKTRQETNKVKEEVNSLNQQNLSLKAKADNEMIDIWRKQLEDNNKVIDKLMSSNDSKDALIDDLKEQLVSAKDALREARSELTKAQRDLEIAMEDIKKLRDVIEIANDLDNTVSVVNNNGHYRIIHNHNTKQNDSLQD